MIVLVNIEGVPSNQTFVFLSRQRSRTFVPRSSAVHPLCLSTTVITPTGIYIATEGPRIFS